MYQQLIFQSQIEMTPFNQLLDLPELPGSFKIMGYRPTCSKLLKLDPLAIFFHVIPVEDPAIHSDVNPWRQRLKKTNRTTHVKQTI